MRDERENNHLIRHVYKGTPGMTDLHTPGTVRYFTRKTVTDGGPKRNGWIREDDPNEENPSEKVKSKVTKSVTEDKPKRTYNKKNKQTKEEEWN